MANEALRNTACMLKANAEEKRLKPTKSIHRLLVKEVLGDKFVITIHP